MLSRHLAAAALAVTVAAPVDAALVTFDFTTEPYPGSSNGLITLSGSALSPATYTGEFGRTIDIVTFLPGGSSGGYALDTFGSGPVPFQNTQIFGQRAFFYFGNNDGPLVEYRFGSAVNLVSATFTLYDRSQNLEIFFRAGGTTARAKVDYFLDTDAYDDSLNLPSVPPETTILFDNTFPLVDQLLMRSLGQSGAALKTLVIDDPAIVAPVPSPTSLSLLVAPLLVLGSLSAARRRARKTDPGRR
jgi:hypothetical protein